MPEPSALAKALAAFQSEMPTVAKSKTANTGSYSYAYADLADVSREAMPLLAKHGLSFLCAPGFDDAGRLVLEGELLHESGESRTGHLPITGTQPQQVGSSITYARRYLFGCLTGIVTDADDDGAAASKPAPKKAQRVQSQAPDPRWDRTPSGEPLLLNTTSKLAKAMYAALNKEFASRPTEMGPDGEIHGAESAKRAFVCEVIGREISSTKELTEAEARKVLDHLPQVTA